MTKVIMVWSSLNMSCMYMPANNNIYDPGVEIARAACQQIGYEHNEIFIRVEKVLVRF